MGQKKELLGCAQNGLRNSLNPLACPGLERFEASLLALRAATLKHSLP